jgi:2-keto-4-pentenoate hydratase/2-oxohepta-3-ene-1,7-dioic acid hydratase in catechol pathway
VRCRVNGEPRQDASTAELVHGVAELIAYCSRSFTLEPGDVIATGTPGGVGAFRDPPVFLADGDTVEVEIEGIGVLTNRCRVVP